MEVTHTVNGKGAIGAAMAAADLMNRGYSVFLPFDGSSPVDLIVADDRMRLARLQVKYRGRGRFDSLEIPLASVVNGKKVPVDTNKIDGWAIFCPETRLVYYVAKKQIDVAKGVFALALERHPGRFSRFCDDYLDPAIFWERAIR